MNAGPVDQKSHNTPGGSAEVGPEWLPGGLRDRAGGATNVRNLALLSLAGLALFLTGLAREPYWDPYELFCMDAARGSGSGRCALAVRVVVSAGLALFGANEFGGRVGFALAAVLCSLATYYAGLGLLRSSRGAFLSAAVFVGSPALAIWGRHVHSLPLSALGVALTIGGLAHLFFVHRAHRRRRVAVHLVLTAVGLALSLGAGNGPASLAPLLALALSLPLTARHKRFVVVAVVIVGAWLMIGRSAPLPDLDTVVETMTFYVRQIAFQFMPWTALLPWAALDRPVDRREARAHSYLILVLLASLVGLSGHPDAALAPLPGAVVVIPLLVGGLLDRWLEFLDTQPLTLFLVAVIVAVVGRDLLVTPGHLLLWNSVWDPPFVFRPTGLALLVATHAAWAAALIVAFRPQLSGRVRLRRTLIAMTVLIAIVGTQLLNHRSLPSAANQVSLRQLYGVARAIDQRAPIIHHHCSDRGAVHYPRLGPFDRIDNRSQLAAAIAGRGRVFALVSAVEIAGIDEAIRAKGGRYHLIDDSNSTCWLLSNSTAPGEPIRPPPFPGILHEAPTVPDRTHASWEDKVDLIGYHLPARFSRKGKFEMRLYFKVRQPLSQRYELAVHLDGNGERIFANHRPMHRRYPTDHWPAGTYVVDAHVVDYQNHDEMPELRARQGEYDVYVAFFNVGGRAQVTEGATDGADRVKVASIALQE
jgi:hypothetical protein